MLTPREEIELSRRRDFQKVVEVAAGACLLGAVVLLVCLCRGGHWSMAIGAAGLQAAFLSCGWTWTSGRRRIQELEAMR